MEVPDLKAMTVNSFTKDITSTVTHYAKASIYLPLFDSLERECVKECVEQLAKVGYDVQYKPSKEDVESIVVTRAKV